MDNFSSKDEAAKLNRIASDALSPEVQMHYIGGERVYQQQPVDLRPLISEIDKLTEPELKQVKIESDAARNNAWTLASAEWQNLANQGRQDESARAAANILKPFPELTLVQNGAGNIDSVKFQGGALKELTVPYNYMPDKH